VTSLLPRPTGGGGMKKPCRRNAGESRLDWDHLRAAPIRKLAQHLGDGF
jgi:hypothetical protein